MVSVEANSLPRVALGLNSSEMSCHAPYWQIIYCVLLVWAVDSPPHDLPVAWIMLNSASGDLAGSVGATPSAVCEAALMPVCCCLLHFIHRIIKN